MPILAFYENISYILKILQYSKIFHSREWVLNEFKKGSTAILVATDVAARSV